VQNTIPKQSNSQGSLQG